VATYITEACINCGACVPVCPNDAISPSEVIYLIDPELCTECVGFHDDEQCQSVCPVACCLPDPEIRETEGELIERAVRLHPRDALLAERRRAGRFPSRFRPSGR
jgi:ferredoxin